MLIQTTAFFGGMPGGPELLLVFLALLLLFGAKRLPEIARSLGKSLEEFRRAAREVSDEIMHAADDEPPAKPSPPQLMTPPESEARGEAKEEGEAEDNDHERPATP